MDPDPDQHQSEKLDPDSDPHQFTDDKPKFMEYEPILALSRGFRASPWKLGSGYEAH